MLHSTLQTGCAEHRPVPAWSTAYRNGVDVHQRRPFSCRVLSPHRRGRADRRLLQCRATSAHEQLVREVLKDSRQHRAHETDVVVIGSGIGGLPVHVLFVICVTTVLERRRSTQRHDIAKLDVLHSLPIFCPSL